MHALSDGKGRPLVLALTSGQAADIKMLPVMLDAVPPAGELLADKALFGAGERRWRGR
ncbi:hypothetical protein [Xanthobacter agilis]|uniref:hypothetical protein n=1 Tax=Xanthobacter agilis TaxID=47492 RepID=UPI003AFFF31A